MASPTIYDPGQRCPGCSGRHWLIGARTAECAACGHAELLAVGARSTLASCVEFLKARGFRLTERRGGRTAKPGYMPFVHADGRTAFVSSGRNVYIDRELVFAAAVIRVGRGLAKAIPA